MEFVSEITVVTGEEGKRLGVVQAEALLDVMRRFCQPSRSDRSPTVEGTDPRDTDACGTA